MRELARVDGALCVPREGKPDENVPLAYVDHLLVDLAGRNGADERHLVEYQPEIVVHEACKNAGAHSALNVDTGVHDGVHGVVEGLAVNVFEGMAYLIHILGEDSLDGVEVADTASCNVHALNGGQAVLYVALERALELRVALVAKLDSKADNGRFADVHSVAEL